MHGGRYLTPMQHSEKTRESLAKVAEEVRAAADKWVASHRRNWPKNTEGDREMRKCGARDAKDMRGVAAFLKKGDIPKAKEAASRLDTIVRDAIPEKFWDLGSTDTVG